MTLRGSDSERLETRIGRWIVRVDHEHTRAVFVEVSFFRHLPWALATPEPK